MGGGVRAGRPSYSPYRSRNRNLSDFVSNVSAGVFVSHHRKDRSQVGLFRYQITNNLDLDDNSLREPLPESSWRGPVSKDIRHSDALIVMIGRDTHKREAVTWEINQAYKSEVPVIGVRINNDKDHKLPKQMIENDAQVVDWDLDLVEAAINNA